VEARDIDVNIPSTRDSGACRGPQPKIAARHVSKSFAGMAGAVTEVLRDINLAVVENEFLVILGPGQCGKSTFLNIVCGLDRPDSGGVYLDGEEVVGPDPRRGMVFQRMALFPWSSVLENVAMGPKLRGMGRKQREEKAAYYIQLVGLAGFEKSYPHQLSGGMKQRVGIAQTRYQMEDEVLRIWGQAKRTVIFVTNNIEEAVYLGNRIVLLGRCPASVKAEYSIDLPWPRRYTDAKFLALRKEIADNSDLAL
jgi:NitT/TauT family transport system ATP-binding protein/sulfonate transport system ATP-binding protein